MTEPAPSDEDYLADRLLEWEEWAGRGEEVSAEALCPDRPDLAPKLAERYARLRGIAFLAAGGPPAPPNVPNPRPPLNPLADRYRLDAWIGDGGFGQVWRGFDLQLLRLVAVKLPRPDRLRATPGGEDAFLAEARRAARLSHPGIVPVYDVGRHQGTTFIVSEFIDGNDLRRRLETEPLEVWDAVRVVERVARHLHHAHRQGLTHRDVKPANILLGRDGRVLLTDFGIAASADAVGRGASGTGSYMAPERLAGDPGLDPRADVYSLGVVLYELLTGRLPDAPTTPIRAGAGVGATPHPPGTLNPDVPPEVERVCLQCLARNPADRPPTAEALADRLNHILTKPDVPGGPGSADRARYPFGEARRSGLETPRAFIPVRTADTWVGRLVYFRQFPEHLAPHHRRALTALCLVRSPLEVKSEVGDRIEVQVQFTRFWVRRADVVPDAEAVAYFTRRMATEPNEPDVRLWRATCLAVAGQSELALDDANRAVGQSPDPALPLTLRGMVWASLGNYANAMADYAEAIHLDPAAPWPWARRASTRLSMGQRSEAIDDYSEAIRRDATDPNLLLFRAALGSQLGRTAGATADLVSASRVDPTNMLVWVECGRLALSLSDFPRAIEFCTAAIESAPPAGLPFVIRGVANSRLGNDAQAVADLGEALGRDLSDQHWIVLLELGELAIRTTVPETVRERLMPSPPGNGWEAEGGPEAVAAVRQLMTGDFSTAVQSLTQALTRGAMPGRRRERLDALRKAAADRWLVSTKGRRR
jgi:tetratricopeptide (TPR) repeat protein